MNSNVNNDEPLLVQDGKFCKTLLPSDFEPTQYSVICGRGKTISNAPGNQRLKGLITTHLKQYSEALTRLEKSSIVSSIVSMIKQASPSGGFVKFEQGCWWEVDDAGAREKVGGLLRDRLHSQYKSSSKAKVAKRRARKAAAAMFDKNKNRMQQPQRATFKNFEAVSLDSYHIPFDAGNNMSSSMRTPGGKPAIHLAHHNKPHLNSRNVAILSSQLELDAIAGGLITPRVSNSTNGGDISTSANVLSYVEKAFGVMNNFPKSSSSNNDSRNDNNNNNDSIGTAKAMSFHNSNNMSSPPYAFGNDGADGGFDDLLLNKSFNPGLVTNQESDITNVIGSDVVMFPSNNPLSVALDDSFFDM